jgi:hypothetical protein
MRIITLDGGPRDGERHTVFPGVEVLSLRDPQTQKFVLYRATEGRNVFSYAGARD